MNHLSEDLELLAEPGRLVTTRYKTYQPGDGVPVRTTVGAPRFWRWGDLAFVSEIAPYGVFRNPRLHSTEAQRMAYADRLTTHQQMLIAKLADLAREHPDQTLCILCYEDVHAGEECHRRWFADWMETRFGILIPEVEANPKEELQP